MGKHSKPKRIKEIQKNLETSFDIADQVFVDLPPDVVITLSRRPYMLRYWDRMRTSKKQSLAIQIARAKQIETWAAGAEDVLSLMSDEAG